MFNTKLSLGRDADLELVLALGELFYKRSLNRKWGVISHTH